MLIHKIFPDSNMCQPSAQARPDTTKPWHADDVLGLPCRGLPRAVRVVAQRHFDFVNHRLHQMAKEPDSGLVHEVPVDRGIQLEALAEDAQLQIHITPSGQSLDGESETAV